MAYKPRLSAPSTTDKLWIKTTKGGYNRCMVIDSKTGSVLPNCVGYAWGRFMEILGTSPKLSTSNAENWWDHNDGYKRSQTPKLGAVICWRKGQAHVGSDGAGHVAVVEAIAADGTITTSNSAYGGSRFYIRELKPPYKMNGYTLQGFILNPAVKDEGVFDMIYETGKYKIVVDGLRVRDKPTVDGKNVGSIKKGDTPSVIGLRISSDNGAWGYLGANRWICIETIKGEKYAERIGNLPDQTERIEKMQNAMNSARAKLDDVSELLEEAAK